MPREPTSGNQDTSASAGASDAHKQDDSRKRARAPASCAECRRLKLKCDKRWPCSSCSKRGCSAICPNGTLAAGPGNRFILAGTEDLHEKIDAMSRRISELEEALAELQAQISNEKHPLLADDLLKVKAPIATQDFTAATIDGTATAAHHLGTLTLGKQEHFFGHHAAADYLLSESCAGDTPPCCRHPLVPLDLGVLEPSFPLSQTKPGHGKEYNVLERWLPPAEEAWKLVEIYYRDATWLSLPIPQKEFNATIFSRVYGGEAPSLADLSPHDIGILYIVLAVGCMVDMDRPPYSADASKYHHLARLAIGSDCIVDHPTIQAIRGVHIMSLFLQMCDHPQAATASYSLVGLNMQLCQSLGLHRDASRWNLCEAGQHIRRRLFWEVATFNCWTSLAFGRPANLSLAQVDAKLPEDDVTVLDDDELGHAAYAQWSHTFASHVLSKVMDEAFGANAPTYATILRLDKLVRDHPVSENLRIINVGQPMPGIPICLLLQRNAVFALTQQLLLLLHRSCFTYSIIDAPGDPLKSKYAQSVLAAFRAAFYLTASVRALYQQAPIALRFWVFWSHSFSACLILAAIVIRAPASGLAPPAWVELARMHELFEQLAPQSRRIARILPAMRTIYARAKEVYTTYAASAVIPPRSARTQIEKELCFMLGQTRLIRDVGYQQGVTNGNGAFTTSASASSTGSSSMSGSGSATSVSPPAAPGAAAATGPPSLPAARDDLFTTLYSSFWSAGDEQQPQQQPQQQDDSWNLDMLASATAPFPQLQPQDLNGSVFCGEAGVNIQIPAFTSDFDLSAMLADPAAGDIPLGDHNNSWQRFVPGFGETMGEASQSGNAYTAPFDHQSSRPLSPC